MKFIIIHLYLKIILSVKVCSLNFLSFLVILCFWMVFSTPQYFPWIAYKLRGFPFPLIVLLSSLFTCLFVWVQFFKEGKHSCNCWYIFLLDLFCFISQFLLHWLEFLKWHHITGVMKTAPLMLHYEVCRWLFFYTKYSTLCWKPLSLVLIY